MGQIFVKGLGTVNIAGDTPTEEESKAIKEKYDSNQEELKEIAADFKVQRGVNYKKLARFGLEVGLSIAGTVATGGLALPAIAARATMLSRPFAVALAKSAAGSGAGGAIGGGASNIFDPSDDIMRDIIRAGVEGAAGELIGAPIVIKGAQGLTKLKSSILNNQTPKGYITPIEGAHNAEVKLFTGEGSQADKVLANPEKYAIDQFVPVSKVIEYAEEAKKGLTTGMKSENRLIDTMENIAEGSFFGADKIIARKEALGFISDTYARDYGDTLVKNMNNTEMGQLFFDTLTEGNMARKAYFNKAYEGIDELYKNLLPQGQRAIPKNIDTKIIYDNANKFIKDNYATPPDAVKSYMNNIKAKFTPKKDPSLKMNFNQLNKYRGEVLGYLRKAIRDGESASIGMYQNILDTVDNKILGNSAYLKKAGIPEEVVGELRKVNAQYREGKTLFEDGILADILTKGNKDGGVDQIYQAIFKGKNKPKTVEVLQDKINTLVKKGFIQEGQAKQLNESLSGQFFNEMMARSQKAGVLNANKLYENLLQNKPIYDKLFTKSQRDGVNKMLKEIAIGQGTVDKKTGLPGKIFIQMKQAGAAGQLLTFGGTGLGLLGGAAAGAPVTGALLGGATVLLGPVAIAKMATSPALNKIIFQGITKTKNLNKYSTQEAALAFRQMVGRLVNEGLVPEDEGKQAVERSKAVEEELLSKGITNAKQFENSVTTEAARAQQQQIKPAPTNMGLSSIAPRTTAPVQTAAAPTTTDRATQYQGLFPFDPTGQAIARS